MKTVAYYRNSISTEKQKLSIEYQKDHLKQVAHRNHLIIDAEYIEPETSGRITQLHERPQLSLLLNSIKRGEVANLLVYTRCRLARNVEQYMEIYELLQEHQINVLFGADNEPAVLYTPEGALIEELMAAIAQIEGERIIARLGEAKVTSTRKGKSPGGPISYGYRRVPDQPGDWEIESNEAEIVETIYREFVTLEFAKFPEFEGHLKDKGIFYKGKTWPHNTLRNVLSNPIYKGVRKYRPYGSEEYILTPTPNLAIVDTMTWSEAQQKLQMLFPVGEKMKVEKPPYPLMGLVFCEECNSALKGTSYKNNHNRVYLYSCKQHPKVKIKKDVLENVVWKSTEVFLKEVLEEHFTDLLQRNMLSEKKALEENMRDLCKDINRAKQQLEKKVDQWLTKHNLETENEIKKLHDFIQDHEFIKDALELSIMELQGKYKKFRFLKDEVMHRVVFDPESESSLNHIRNLIHRITLEMDGKATFVFKHPIAGNFVGVETHELA